MTKKKLRKIVIIITIILIIIGGCIIFIRPTPNEASISNNTYVRTVVLNKGSLNQTVSTSGTISSNQVSSVSTNLTYPIKTIEVEVGDVVNEGDVIATLDSSEIESQITKANEALQENIDNAYENYQNALSEKEKRYSEMISAEENYNSKLSTYNSALSNYNNAASTLGSYQSAYDNAKANMETNGQALNSAQSALENKKIEDQSCESDECKALQSSYDSAKSSYDASVETFNNAETALNEAKVRTNYDSYLQAYNSASEQYNSASTALEQAQQTFSTADANVLNAQEAYESSKTSDELTTLNEQLANCTLTAQTSGTVTSINATVGSRPTETIATIQDINDLIVDVTIEEYDMQDVEIGMRCIITSDATDNEMEGELIQINPVANTNNMSTDASSTFSAKVKLNNPDENIMIGMNAKVEIVISSLEDVYTVPIDALEEQEDGTYVIYVQNEESGEFAPVSVTKGEENDYYVQISGDDLSDGMIVRASANEQEATESMEQPTGIMIQEGEMQFSGEGGGFNLQQGGGPRP